MNTFQRFGALITLAVSLLLSAPAQASMLTNNAYLYIPTHGPIDATLDGNPVFSMCIDFFNFSSVPGAMTGTSVALDLNNVQARVHALSMYVLLNSGVSHTANTANHNNPLTPLTGDAVKFWQYVTWEASTALTPDFNTFLAPVTGGPAAMTSSDTATALMQAALGSMTLVQFLTGGTGVGADFASFTAQLTYFVPDDKHNQRFVLFSSTQNSTSQVPEPATAVLFCAGVALVAGGSRRRRLVV